MSAVQIAPHAVFLRVVFLAEGNVSVGIGSSGHGATAISEDTDISAVAWGYDTQDAALCAGECALHKQLLAAETLLDDDMAFLAQANQMEYRLADVNAENVYCHG